MHIHMLFLQQYCSNIWCLKWR